jgi:Ca2+-transporting ATPase
LVKETIVSTPFDINSTTGLSDQEAAVRLQREGYNELPSTKQRSIFAIAFDVVRATMFLLLVACGSVYLVLGDMQKRSCFWDLFSLLSA